MPQRSTKVFRPSTFPAEGSLSELYAELLGLPNVHGCYTGRRWSKGKRSDELAFVCCVGAKIPRQRLSATERVPRRIKRLRTRAKTFHLRTGRLGDLTQLQAGKPEWKTHAFPGRQCWNSTVAINIAGPQEKQISYSLQQATHYRATLHLGTVFTESHETTFGLRPVSPTEKRGFAEGPVEKGPEYVAALVFYSALRYIPFLGGHTSYAGGIQWPATTGSTSSARSSAWVFAPPPNDSSLAVPMNLPLAPTSSGSTISERHTSWLVSARETGTVEEILTRKVWGRKFVWGITLDLVDATNAFRR